MFVPWQIVWRNQNELNISFEKEWVVSAGDQTGSLDQKNPARDHCATENTFLSYSFNAWEISNFVFFIWNEPETNQVQRTREMRVTRDDRIIEQTNLIYV